MDAFTSAAARSFRDRMTFHCGATMGFTCAVYLMGILRPVLEPFFWALFLVTALEPLSRFFEGLLLGAGELLCGAFRRRRGRCLCASPCSGERRGMVDVAALSPLWHIAPEDGDVSCKESCCACLSRLISVLGALLVVFLALFGMACVVIDGVVRVQKDLPLYELGAHTIVQRAKAFVKSLSLTFPEAFLTMVSEKLLDEAKLMLSTALGGLLEYLSNVIFELLMLGLYVLFWLCTPMPIASTTETIFRRYLFLKGTACLGYGVCVGLVFYLLKLQLPVVFGLTSFVLSFIPEVGAFLAMLLSVPVILFDSRHEAALVTFLSALAAQLGLKFFFTNIVEVKLVENDSTMKMHPVVTLLAVTFFGFLWGPTGMLLSVPMMTYFKAVLLVEYVPPGYRDPLLILIEGDRMAPKRHRARMKDLSTEEWQRQRHNSD
ncbi:unnamed protein product [Durusdinium trenchii]|uniref:Transmembrane protein n=1 Tax=Durusdinium trenchii TaxID=1381693 RepID=A0ABP0SYG9_9DINO